MSRLLRITLVCSLGVAAWVAPAWAQTCSLCYGSGTIWVDATYREPPKTSMIMPGDRNWLRGGATHYLHDPGYARPKKTQVKKTCPRCKGSGFEPWYTPPTAAERARAARDARDGAIRIGGQRYIEGRVWGRHGYQIIRQGNGQNARFGMVGGRVTSPRIVVPLVWQHIDPPDGKAKLIRAKRGGKWGYLNMDAQVAIAPIWDEAVPFLPQAKGYAAVKRRGRWGLIDVRGRTRTVPQYDELIPLDSGHWFARKGAKWGVVFPGIAKPVLAIEWDFIRRNGGNGRFLVQRGDRFGLYSRHGRVIVPAQYTKFTGRGGTFTVWVGALEGRVVNGVEVVAPAFTKVERRGDQWIGTRPDGKEVLHTQSGVARVGVDSLVSVGDLMLVTIRGKQRLESADGHVLMKAVLSARTTEGGRYVVETRKGFGLMDAAGKLVVKPRYQALEADGLERPIRVRRRGKWGALTGAGKRLVPLRYDAFEVDGEGFRVQREGLWGLLDGAGKRLGDAQYTALGVLEVGRRTAQRDGKWGYLDERGRPITPFTYEHAEPFGTNEAVARVRNGDKWGLVGLDGEVRLPLEYTRLEFERRRFVRAVKPGLPAARFKLDDLRRGVVKNLVPPPKPRPAPPAKRPPPPPDDRPRKRGCEGKKWGFKDAKGAWIVPCVYDQAYSFTKEEKGRRKAWVRRGDRWGLVGDGGAVVLKVAYDELRDIGDYMAFLDDDEWGIFDERTQKIILEPDCDQVEPRKGIVACREDDDWSWVERDGSRRPMPPAEVRTLKLFREEL